MSGEQCITVKEKGTIHGLIWSTALAFSWGN